MDALAENRMARLKPVLIFLIQSVVVGLAAAFVVVLVRPQLLPAISVGGGPQSGQPSSYADAVDVAAPSVANVYSRRLISDTGQANGSGRFRHTTGRRQNRQSRADRRGRRNRSRPVEG